MACEGYNYRHPWPTGFITLELRRGAVGLIPLARPALAGKQIDEKQHE